MNRSLILLVTLAGLLPLGMRIHAAGHVTLSGASVPWGASLGVELHRPTSSRGP